MSHKGRSKKIIAISQNVETRLIVSLQRLQIEEVLQSAKVNRWSARISMQLF
jgi:hypothetical protein